MNKPSVNTQAPDFTAFLTGGGCESGSQITLSQLRDKPVVLYFYPKDDTPGCTAQACALRDSWADLADKAHLIGVSTDPLKSHDKFIEKHELPFLIIADEDKSVVKAYGVWVEKQLYGRTYMGTERSTFVINTSGTVTAVLEKVKPAQHVRLVLQALG